MAKDTSIEALRKKEGRGAFLTTMLVVESLPAMFFGLLIISTILKYNHLVPNIISISLPLLVMMASLVGIWKWSKVAIYGWIAFFVYIIFKWFATGTSAFDYIQVILIYLMIGWLFFWAVKRKWHLFK